MVRGRGGLVWPRREEGVCGETCLFLLNVVDCHIGETCQVDATGRDLGEGGNLKNATLDEGDALHLTVAVAVMEQQRSKIIEVDRSRRTDCESLEV